MASDVNAKKGTSLFMRSGHTAGAYGNDPTVTPKGGLAAAPKELKP